MSKMSKMTCRLCRDIGYRNLGEIKGTGVTSLVPCVACGEFKKLTKEFEERKKTADNGKTLPAHIWNPRQNNHVW